MIKGVIFDFYGVIFDRDSRMVHSGVLSLIKELYAKNVSLYLFSNTRKEALSLLNVRYEFFKYFKHIILPAEVDASKPSEESFNYLFEFVREDPEELFLIDDEELNIISAKRYGINGMLFSNDEELRLKLVDLQAL